MVWKRENTIPYHFKSERERKAFEKFYHVETEDTPPRPMKWYVTPELTKNGLYTLHAVFKGKDRTGLVARFDGLPLWITPWESYTGCLSRAGFKQAIRRFGHYINARMVEVKPLNAINEFHIAETVICVFSFLNGYTVLPSRTIPDGKHKDCLFSLHLQRGLQNPCYQHPVKVIANKLQKYPFCAFSNDPQEIRKFLANTEQITAYKEYLIGENRGK